MPSSRLSSALTDVTSGVAVWRIWLSLAWTDIKTRYRRSMLGQFWITLSMALLIAALALVYSAIFHISLKIYIPWIGTSIICWGLLAGLITEGSGAFIEAEGYIRSTNLPRSTFVYRVLLRNAVVFGHNLILVPIIFLLAGTPVNACALLFIPAFLLTVATGGWLALVLGPLTARFRDLPLMISSLVQIAFFISPVMWERKQLSAAQQQLVNINPFAIYLELLRSPLLGQAPSAYHWLFACGMVVFGWLFALVIYSYQRPRIAFYL